jgi:hypothetical protein
MRLFGLLWLLFFWVLVKKEMMNMMNFVGFVGLFMNINGFSQHLTERIYLAYRSKVRDQNEIIIN